MIFFTLHKEGKIGYKLLSPADLGLSDKSHQTHIGLFDDVLTFLANNAECDAMLIYNNTVIDDLSLAFDRIENPNHTFRSPKIRMGGKGLVTVVAAIRDIVKKNGGLKDKWYLIWFGLENELPVFFLFNEKSQAFEDVKKIGLDLGARNEKGRITEKDSIFKKLVSYLQGVVNKTNLDYFEKLEVAAQSGNENKKIRTYDFLKAKEISEKIGREGEEIINQYFEICKSKGIISSFTWYNKDKESGCQYDFHIELPNGNVVYLDVKTTSYLFSQKIIFSDSEIDFACKGETQCSYNIYRVYRNNLGEFCLRICQNPSSLFSEIEKAVADFTNELKKVADLETAKISILPSSKELSFDNEINLTRYIADYKKNKNN